MAPAKSEGTVLPSYRKPPVIEVVCGLRFEPLEGLKIPHIGLFWEKVRKEFPNCQHAAPLGVGPGTIDPDIGLPLLRVWLINKANDRLIQIQRDAFIYNWRKRQENRPYPRYRRIISSFERNLDRFTKFLDDHGINLPTPTECELTYINHIVQGEGWQTAADSRKIFRDFNWRSGRGRFLHNPLETTWQAAFALPEDKGRLNVKLEQGTRKIDDMPVLVLTLSARGIGSDKSLHALWSWFPIAHEWIVRGFADLASSQIQREVWERDDDFAG